MNIESADDFAREFDVRGLVFADRHEQVAVRFAVHDDVGGLEERIAEEAVGAEVAVFEIFDLFFVGGDAFEPA